MEKTEFHVGDLPSGFHPAFDPYLFNQKLHRSLQASTWQSYHLLRKDKVQVLASVHFHVEKGVAQSPYRAPFGSYQFSKSLQPESLFNFVRRVDDDLRSKRIKKVLVKNPPSDYSSAHASLLDVVLLNQGYRIGAAEIGATLSIDDVKFSEKIHGWEGRKLRQNHRAKNTFQVLPVRQLPEVYAFIRSCRMERKQSISMTKTEIEEAIETLPKQFVLFGVFKGDELAAASISTRINKSILYNFYSAHPKKFDQLSPVVLLMEGIYRWCQKQKVTLLDLGTSAIEGAPNFRLLDFKIHLGGVPCRKLAFTKDL